MRGSSKNLRARIAAVFQRVLGEANIESSDPSMGGEDFSRYGKAGVPILMFRLGTIDAQRLRRYRQLDQPPPSLHSAKYYPDAEPTLKTGVTATAAAAMQLLQKN